MGHRAKANTMKLNRDKCEVLCLALVLDRPGLETHICLFCLSALVLQLAAQRMLSGLLERVKCKDSEQGMGVVNAVSPCGWRTYGENTFCIYAARSIFSKQDQ